MAANDAAVGRTYLAAHRDSISTRALVSTMRGAMSRPARLISVPAGVLEGAAALAGQEQRMQRLTRSLQVDPGDAERELGWTAQIGFGNALEDMVRAYRQAAR